MNDDVLGNRFQVDVQHILVTHVGNIFLFPGAVRASDWFLNVRSR